MSWWNRLVSSLAPTYTPRVHTNQSVRAPPDAGGFKANLLSTRQLEVELALADEEEAVSLLDAVAQYAEMLQRFLDDHPRPSAPAAEADAGPLTTFFNAEKYGRPTSAEVLLYALLLIQNLSPEKLSQWVKETLLQEGAFTEKGDEWALPAGSWAPEQMMRKAIHGNGAPKFEACARVMYREGAVAAIPEVSTLRGYIGDVERDRKFGPKRGKGGKASSRRNIVAMVPVAQLLNENDGKRRAQLARALEGTEEPKPNASQLTKAQLQKSVSNLRKTVAATAAVQRQAEAAEARAQAGKRKAEEAAGALLAESKAQKMAHVKEIVDALKKKRRDKAAEVRAGEQEKARARVQGQITKQKRLKNKANERARDLESALASHKRTSESRLKSKEEATAKLKEAQQTIEEYGAKLNAAHFERQASASAQEKLQQMPTWRPVVGKGSGRGGQKMEWGMRVIIFMMLAQAVPPAAIGVVIVAIVKRTAPWLDPVVPNTRTIRDMRFELRSLEEALAGRRVAAAYRVRQLGFDETTKFQDPSMVTSVLIQPTPNAPAEVVIMRAAYATGGGTSQRLVDATEEKCFARLRSFLEGWEKTCKRMYPNHKWTGPDPALCGLQRLGGGGAIQSDTCTPARCTKRLLAAEIARQVKAKHSDWESLSEESQEEAIRVHTHDCWQHIRNIFLSAMSTAQSAHVKDALKEELEAFASWERMDTAFDNLLRAHYKEFHHEGRYYKGHGKDFAEWMRDNYPSVFWMHLERAEAGRQDLDYDAAVPMYVMRRYHVEWLHARVHTKGHQNILEDFLYQALITTEYLAMIRANAIVDLLLARPMRWMAGKSADMVDWSPYSMGPVLETVEQLLERGARDGRVLMKPELFDWTHNSYLFKAVVDQQPAFRDYLTHMYTEDTVMSPDGKTKHPQFKRALDELLDPTDTTNQRTRELTAEYLQVQCAAGLRKLHDKATVLPEYLTSQDGSKCWAKVAQAHSDTIGTEASNDKFAESVFGVFDRMLKLFHGISREAASGLAQAVRAKSFWLGDAARHPKPKEQPKEQAAWGYFHTLPIEEQEALVEYVRVHCREHQAMDRAHNAEVAAYVKSKAKTSSEEELAALVKEFGYGLSFFDRWQQRGVRRVGDIAIELRKLVETDKRKTRQAQLDWLREQIEMRTRGLRWTDFVTKWSSKIDEDAGSVEDLTGHLKEIVEHEIDQRTAGELPDDAPAPIMKAKTYKELGTRTAQAEELGEATVELTYEELRALAERERERLEAAGEICAVGDSQPQGAPPFASLLGRQIEVRWRYYVKDPTMKSGRRQQYIWCEGTVVEVANGRTTKKSAACTSPLPWGAVRIQWPEDASVEEKESFTWSVLKPAHWCKEAHLSWRYAAPELVKLRQERLRTGK